MAFYDELLTPLANLPFGPGQTYRFDGRVVDPGDLVVETNTGNKNRWIGVTVRGCDRTAPSP